MAKILVRDDADTETLAEYYIADEYVENALREITERIRVYVSEQERQKLLEEQSSVLTERIDAKVSRLVKPVASR